MEVLENRVYQHFKGNYYLVLSIARDTENPNDRKVVYKSLYGEGTVWVRPYGEFDSSHPDSTFPGNARFRLVNDFGNTLESFKTEAIVEELKSRGDADLNSVVEVKSSDYVVGNDCTIPTHDQEVISYVKLTGSSFPTEEEAKEYAEPRGLQVYHRVLV